MTAPVLVAGVGNIFLGDDGFGVEVARRLQAETLPDGVRVADFGIRGVHLAYELLDGYECLVLVDALSQGGTPGDLYVFEPARNQGPGTGLHDAHDLSPATMLALVDDLAQSFGGGVKRVVVVGCEPADISDTMGLSAAVEAAVPEACRIIQQTAAELAHEARAGGGKHDAADADRRGPAGGGRGGGAVDPRPGEIPADPEDVSLPAGA